MKLTLPYGEGMTECEMAWGRHIATLDVADVPQLAGLDHAIERALSNPIGLDRSIFDIARPGETVTILVSDSFRKTCVHHVLPVLLDGLGRAGIRDEDISFVFATGTHRAPTSEEQAIILGRAVHERFAPRLYVHDASDTANMAYVGTTSRGTRMSVNRRAVECDRLIATGATVLHYFGGFGGGRKAVMPGISSVEAISRNHSLNLDPVGDGLNPSVRIGRMDGNPVAEDMLEAARLVGVDYVINTVLNRRGEIAGVFAGELDAAHRVAAEFAYELFAVHIGRRADLVIASSGATKNFVQSHKALFNAYQAVKPGGRIILAAKCEEGLGGESFEKWLRLGSRDAVIAALRHRSEINGQTALSTLEKARITTLVTDMPEDKVAMLGGRKAASLRAALDAVREEFLAEGVADPAYYVMPSAAYSVPFLERG